MRLPVFTAERVLTPEPLNVVPELVGQRLATPARRALAMGVDLVVIALLAGVGGFWLAAGLVLVVLQLRRRSAGNVRVRTIVGWLLAALFVTLAAGEAWMHWHAPAKATAAVIERDDDDDDDVADAVTSKALAGLSDAQRIAVLEAELKEARKHRPVTLQEELDRIAHAIGASFGWGIVYFSLLPALWGGQSLGKKILGLRVVELTGKPMTVALCFKRYGGYAAGMATGGLGFTQLLWDINHQAIQDRAAHTVVIDVRAPMAATVPSQPLDSAANP